MDAPNEAIDIDAVRRIPPSPGLSFRGRGSGTWQLGTTYCEAGWVRSSRDVRVGSNDFAHGNVVVLFGACGRDLHSTSAPAQEQETVYLPGSSFRLLRQGFLGATWLQIVTMLRDDGRPERDRDLDEQVRRAVDVVTRALALPPAHPRRPARFSGAFGQPVVPTPGHQPTTPQIAAH